MSALDLLGEYRQRGIVPLMVVRHPVHGVFTVKTFYPEVAKVEAMLEWGLRITDMEDMTVSIKKAPATDG